jgi:hypothetical protein
MKCDNFLTFLETGSPLARLEARVHAWRCATCAATHKRLIALREELTRPDTLTPFHRRFWERTALETRAEPKWQSFVWPRLAVAGGLAAVVVLCFSVFSRWHNDPANRQVVTSDIKQSSNVQTISLVVPPRELAALENELMQVSADLDRLAEQATMIEVRQVIGELTATYRPLGPNDS